MGCGVGVSIITVILGFGVAGVNILVKETPVKKQVDDYHKFKQERLR